jgi:hypothetical protein
MSLPPHEPRKLPEGRYTFKVAKEPEKNRKQGKEGPFVAVKFFFKVQDSLGNVRDHIESILPWEDRYRDILLALGGEEDEMGAVHLGDMIDIIGKKFKAYIKHVPDKDDRTKTWARIASVEINREDEGIGQTESYDSEDVPPPIESEEDEIPF